MRTWKTKNHTAVSVYGPIAPADTGKGSQRETSVSAQAAVLMDADSGRVIYGLNENQTLLIASTTKIMTALIAIENCNLKDTVNIKREWTLAEGSSMYLQAGETYTVEELLYGLMLASGNDAALALACHTAGTVEAFAEL
jgi:D-alanyl-D-alanine carboxypeptidase